MHGKDNDGLHTHVSHHEGGNSFDVAEVASTKKLDVTHHISFRSQNDKLITGTQRYLETLPVVAFGITIVGTWEATANGIQPGFLNGGPSSIVWGFLVSGACTLTIVLSLAEMASITPSVGAQYRWTAIYCPSFLDKRFFSFIQGWLTVWAWNVSATLLPFFTGSQILGLVTFNHPDYVYKGWHALLIAYATILIPLIANLFARRLLKPIEIFGAVWHFISLVTIVVVLIALGGRNSASFVFTGNSGNISGWENGFVQWCLGMLTAVLPLTGRCPRLFGRWFLLTHYCLAFDGVLHLSKLFRYLYMVNSHFQSILTDVRPL